MYYMYYKLIQLLIIYLQCDMERAIKDIDTSVGNAMLMAGDADVMMLLTLMWMMGDCWATLVIRSGTWLLGLNGVKMVGNRYLGRSRSKVVNRKGSGGKRKARLTNNYYERILHNISHIREIEENSK